MDLRTTVLISAVLAITAAGCDDDDDAPAPSTNSARPSTSAPEPAPSYEATVGGEPVHFRSILARSTGGRALELFFGTDEHSCAEMTDRSMSGAPEETFFMVRLSPRLQPDGSEQWVVTKALFDGRERKQVPGRVELSARDADDAVAGALRVALEGQSRDEGEPRRLRFSGDFTAKGCGTVDDAGQLRRRPQKDLRLTVAGRRFAVNGATLSPFGDKHKLVMSTRGHGCDRALVPAGDLAVTLDLEGEPPAVTKVWLGGDVVESSGTRITGNEIDVKTDDPLEGKGNLGLEVTGEAAIGNMPVTFGGSLEAERCERPSAPGAKRAD